MENGEITLAWMYPDILNQHGDRGNIMAFEKIAKKLNIKLNIKRINTYKEQIDLKNTDIMFFSPGELKVTKKIILELNKYKKQLEEYINNDKTIICIGTSVAIFAKDIIKQNGEKYKGLDFLDITCIERETIIGDDLYYSIDDTEEIIGSQIQTIDVILNSGQALGTIKYGYGNNGTEQEGAKHKNLIFTNALGPVFVKNVWWTEKILTDIAEKKKIQVTPIPVEEYEIEILSFNTTKKFIETKEKNKK